MITRLFALIILSSILFNLLNERRIARRAEQREAELREIEEWIKTRRLKAIDFCLEFSLLNDDPSFSNCDLNYVLTET